MTTYWVLGKQEGGVVPTTRCPVKVPPSPRRLSPEAWPTTDYLTQRRATSPAVISCDTNIPLSELNLLRLCENVTSVASSSGRVTPAASPSGRVTPANVIPVSGCPCVIPVASPSGHVTPASVIPVCENVSDLRKFAELAEANAQQARVVADMAKAMLSHHAPQQASNQTECNIV